MSHPEKKKESKRLFVRITCLVLAVSMVAATVLVVLSYLTDMFS